MHPARKPIVLITGVSTGIGLALCRMFLTHDWKVYGSVRKQSDCPFDSRDFPDFELLIFDVTDHEAIQKATFKIKTEHQTGIDLLINNAGIAVGGPLVHIPMEEFRYQFEVNVFGLLAVTQAFYPLLRSKGNKPAGRIIQISSVSGKIGFPFVGAYAASKFAVEGLSETLRRELIKDEIKVIVVGPGAVKTPIWEKSVSPVASKYSQTEYAAAIEKVNNFFVNTAVQTGLEASDVATRIFKIANKKTPRSRYTMISRYLTGYLLPLVLPASWIDRLMTRRLFN